MTRTQLISRRALAGAAPHLQLTHGGGRAEPELDSNTRTRRGGRGGVSCHVPAAPGRHEVRLPWLLYLESSASCSRQRGPVVPSRPVSNSQYLIIRQTSLHIVGSPAVLSCLTPALLQGTVTPVPGGASADLLFLLVPQQRSLPPTVSCRLGPGKNIFTFTSCP